MIKRSPSSDIGLGIILTDDRSIRRVVFGDFVIGYRAFVTYLV